MKIALIVPYFGKFPSYFQLTLNSCAINSSHYDWLFFTDDRTRYQHPNNVKFVYTSFENMKKIVQSKFDFRISLNRPYKLCDYKPAYGWIFAEYLKSYDYWGHCDIDCIYGNFDNVLNWNNFPQYDKILRLGHLTMYRNTLENNCRFMNQVRGEYRYRSVYETEKSCLFDEDNACGYPCIEDIWRENGYTEYCQDDAFANIAYKGCIFQLLTQLEKSNYQIEKKMRSIFFWKDGELIRVYEKDGELRKREYAYIHLMSRPMTNKLSSTNTKCYKIIPNAFEDTRGIPTSVREFRREKWFNFNFQYIKKRSNNLRIKLLKLWEKMR